MIKWTSVKNALPDADRELVAKSPLKIVGFNSHAKQCRIMKFHKDFTNKQISDLMLSENFTIWSYTEGSSDD